MESVAIQAHRADGQTERVSEATDVHTRILRLALGIEDSRSYWEHVDPAVPTADRGLIAFEQRWFGSKSLERVRFLLSNFVDRYDAYPEALEVLRRWRSMEASARQVVCHWHLQLSDPLYRRFTGQFLVERRAQRDPKVDRDIALRWVKNEFPNRWSEATCVQFRQQAPLGSVGSGRHVPQAGPPCAPPAEGAGPRARLPCSICFEDSASVARSLRIRTSRRWVLWRASSTSAFERCPGSRSAAWGNSPSSSGRHLPSARGRRRRYE